MDLILVAGGCVGVVASLLACFACYEMSLAYWVPTRASQRWRAFVESPKLAYFAPTFRWFMPLFAIYMLVQLGLAVKLIAAGVAGGA